jgi:hypothetical protein
MTEAGYALDSPRVSSLARPRAGRRLATMTTSGRSPWTAHLKGYEAMTILAGETVFKTGGFPDE